MMVCMPVLGFSQSATQPINYEGATDKEGRPDGYGTMHFDAVYNGIAYTERLEGTWKKGVPVEGKCFRYYKDSGKIRMRFEGKFKMKEKGVLRNLWDLKWIGNIVFYYYEDNKYYDERGYFVRYGEYDYEKDHIKKGYCVSSKKKAMTPLTNGIIGDWSTNLSPEARKYLDELFPSVGSAWIFDREPEFQRRNVAGKKDSFVKLNNISWSASLTNGFLDGKGCGSFTKKLANNKTLEYTFEGEFRNGVPVNVRINRTLLIKGFYWTSDKADESIIQVTTGELRNNLRPFKVDNIKGRSFWHEDYSYEGYVDENFKFKSDYSEQADKEWIAKTNKAWEGLYKTTAAAIGTVAAVANKLAPNTPSKTYDTGSVEIDWGECKEPSGDLVQEFNIFGAIFGTNEWESENPGVIVIKNIPDKYVYRIIYYPDKTFRCYYLKGPYARGTFKTKEDMIKAIVEGEKQYRKKY